MVNFRKTGYLWSIKLLMMITIVGSGMNYTSQRSFAQEDQPPLKFFCGTYQGSPATMVTTPRGDVAIIVWLSNYSSNSGYTPLERCKAVSQRFQNTYDQGVLKYITAGTVNGIPVICATETSDDSCSKDRVLFTLPLGTDPDSVLNSLDRIDKPACATPSRDGLCSGWLNSIPLEVLLRYN